MILKKIRFFISQPRFIYIDKIIYIYIYKFENKNKKKSKLMIKINKFN